jgi:hypothetical protein
MAEEYQASWGRGAIGLGCPLLILNIPSPGCGIPPVCDAVEESALWFGSGQDFVIKVTSDPEKRTDEDWSELGIDLPVRFALP